MNGKYYPQTKSILKYLAVKAKLVPKDPELHLLSDVIIDTLDDIWKGNSIVLHDPPEKILVSFKEIEDKWHQNKDFLSKIVTSDGFIGGTRPCHADFLLLHVLDQLYTVKPTLDVPENLAEFRVRVGNLPGIKEYLEERGPLDEKRVKILRDLNL